MRIMSVIVLSIFKMITRDSFAFTGISAGLYARLGDQRLVLRLTASIDLIYDTEACIFNLYVL